jgi:glycine rich protein
MAIDLFGPASASGATSVRPAETRTFTPTDSWFRDCSDPTLDDGTELIAAWFNGVLGQMRNLARSNGQTGAAVDVVAQDNGDDALLLKAIQHLIQRGQPLYAEDSGTPNHIVCSLSPAPAEWKKGMEIHVKISNLNSAATDIALNALPVKSVVNPDGSALSGGELVVGEQVTLRYDGTACQLISRVANDKVAAGFRNFVAFQASGTFVVPANITKVYFELWGGGGGGGATSGASTAGGGGGGGGHVRGTTAVTPGASVPITVGAGGLSAVFPNPGGNGGTSSFGAIASALGGGGGGSAGPGAASALYGTNGSGGTASGPAGSLQINGELGAQGYNSRGGDGGSSFGFAGVSSDRFGAPAPNGAYGFASGGSGASPAIPNPSNGGGPGLVLIWY